MSSQEQPFNQQRSLYRRHRPRTFAEVVGQEPVVRTLRNAVERDQVHHAYLFVGSRGTGKTSMAKILASCLNCERGERDPTHPDPTHPNLTHPDPAHPTVEPCGECESCVSIARATSLDVIEMDAASNNSVDDIRELRESVAYAPVSGRRKVYILDEAHMLSTAAWNAFLKTLEEPPPSTVFVLATTEAQKVPATVVDRCHRFDFQRPTVEQIAEVVRRAAAAESIEIPPAAVAALARAATGSFRDALGTLEQLVTYSGREIALEDVLAVLGVADASLLEATVDAVAAGDAARALRTLEECAEHGRDAGAFASDLEVRARELMVVQVLDEVPSELSLTAEADAALAAQAERVEQTTVVRLLELVGEAMEAVRAGADARTRLELALVKAARPQADGSMRALLARIERLEHANAGASGEGGDRAGGNGGQANALPAPDPPAAEQQADDEFYEGPPQAAGVGVADGEAAAASAPAAERSPAPEIAREADSALEADAARELESVTSLWPAVVDLVRSENAMLWACIVEARPAAVDGDELTLAYPASAEFHRKKAEGVEHRTAVSEALRSVTGVRWQLRYELREELGEGERPELEERSEEQWVARFMQEFAAEELSDGSSPEGEDAVSDAVDPADATRLTRSADDEAVTSNEKGA